MHRGSAMTKASTRKTLTSSCGDASEMICVLTKVVQSFLTSTPIFHMARRTRHRAFHEPAFIGCITAGACPLGLRHFHITYTWRWAKHRPCLSHTTYLIVIARCNRTLKYSVETFSIHLILSNYITQVYRENSCCSKLWRTIQHLMVFLMITDPNTTYVANSLDAFHITMHKHASAGLLHVRMAFCYIVWLGSGCILTYQQQQQCPSEETQPPRKWGFGLWW